ncbi:helix-turn-helix domain-containing protein [Anaerocolumna sp.]|uniref:helix-turn-helix domain-containing protein n=1 Tax=Anaerocolumna sp. TaxID=2041569 RepID=UPI0028B017F6|nr:AraC family transcriptional regulator [Anaerocolumna sp.]
MMSVAKKSQLYLTDEDQTIDINNLVIQYGKANIELDGIYEIVIPAGTKSKDQTTMKGVCGFVIPIRGKACFTLCGYKYELEPGMILHAGSGMDLEKEVIGDSEWRYILMHYKIPGSEEVKLALESTHYMVKIPQVNMVEIQKLLQRLLVNQKSSSVDSTIKNKALLYLFIDLVLQSARQSTIGEEEERIQYIVDYIHNNLDKNIAITELAEKIGMNSKKFYYLFLKTIGICPKKYITKCRIKYAKELLIKEQYTIIDVANMTGYEDVFHFSRMFKKATGVAPSKFRETIEKNPW